MSILAKVIIAIVAIEHIGILWFEMFAWTTVGRKVFAGALPKDLFEPTKVLAANQGLYNGFLVAGLIWSLLISNVEWSQNVALFFLGCVAVAGIYGAMTAKPTIFFVQTVPALIGIALVLWA